MWRPWRTVSSATLATTVTSAGSTTWTRPVSRRAAPTPPARTQITGGRPPGSGEVAQLAAHQRQVGFDHHVHQALERDLGLPAERGASVGRVADQEVDLGGPEVLRVLHHEVAVVEVD